MYLAIERRPIARSDHRAGVCAHTAAAALLRVRFVVGRRTNGAVRTAPVEHWPCIRECCARDTTDPLGRERFWSAVDDGAVTDPPGAPAVDWGALAAWGARVARVAAVIPRLTPADTARCKAWHGLRLRCGVWADGCASHGGKMRCEVCALGRAERRRRDWARVDRAGDAWRRFRQLAAAEPERVPPAGGMFEALHHFDHASALDLPHFPCSRALVLAAHRVQVLLEHPDVGGSPVLAAKANAARDALLPLAR